MRKSGGIILTVGLLFGSLSAAPAHAEDAPPPPNAIVSEGNGAAVFIGYGADKAVNLSWRPSKKYEGATMLYQVQRGDGAMLESKTSGSSFKDVNLTPNSTYAYTLITFQSVKRTYVIKKGASKGQRVTRTVTKRVGKNQISVLTLPTMVVGLSATSTLDTVDLAWQAPQYTANPVTYKVVMNGNLMGYGLTTGAFHLGSLSCGSGYSLTVITQNATGDALTNAKLTAKTTKCPT
jgi:hypothetical protein